MGSPYRLALSFESDDYFDTHVLLDQIPHNEDGETDKYHRVWVDIPNVDCVNRNCSLQLIQVMTDKFEGTCAPEELSEMCNCNNCVYFSCANIEIQGDSTVWPPVDFYTSYDGATEAQGWTDLSGTWELQADGVWELPGQSGESNGSSTLAWTLVIAGIVAIAAVVIGVNIKRKQEDDAGHESGAEAGEAGNVVTQASDPSYQDLGNASA